MVVSCLGSHGGKGFELVVVVVGEFTKPNLSMQ